MCTSQSDGIGGDIMSIDRMIRYLVLNTRYTEEYLRKLPIKKLEQWYKEEKQINKEG
jgi:hypothetical protein